MKKPRDPRAVIFGQRLKALRQEKRMFQREVAKAAFITRNYVAVLEGGHNLPSLEVAENLAHALGVSTEYLIRPADDGQELLEVTGTDVPSLPPGRADYYGEQEIRQIARSVMEEMGGFVAIRIIGYVPADTTRWASWEHEDRTMPFERELLGSRSPDQFYVLIASGDCMVARDIPNGAAVLIREFDPGERPQHDDIVVVRVGDEYTLKVWSVEGGRTCLRDGDGNLIIELDDADDVHVLGVAISSRIDLRRR